MRRIDADRFKDDLDFICGAGGSLQPVTSAVIEFVKKRIDAQPTVEPKPKWILCSERLPEVRQRVIVTFKDGSVSVRRCIDGGHLTWFYANTIAWMPCPEPYQEGEQDG